MTTTTACPECDCAELQIRRGGGMHAEIAPTTWKCKGCGHEFDNPVEREAKAETISAECILERLGVDPEVAMND